jgi:hypothetical protein
MTRLPAVFATALAVCLLITSQARASDPTKHPEQGPRLSAMGELFRDLDAHPERLAALRTAAMAHAPAPWGAPAVFGGDLNLTPGAPRFQSETTIAVKGDTIVVGFNDANGFANPSGVSVSGFAYSHDGGTTFTYGGQLPLVGGGDMVRGDPGVNVWVNPSTGAATFVYSSLYRTPAGESSLCIHVSTDGGVTWSAPRVTTPVTSASAFADKVFNDVDPETGRVLLSWTSFGATVQMSAIRSDNFGLSWSPITVFSARSEDGQGSCPRFDPTSGRAYIVWRAYGAVSAVSLVRSLDNGVTWSTAQDIALGGSEPLPPFGSDRINDFPAIAVSPTDGSLHVVYASLQTADFGDVYYARSTDQGLNWSVPVTLNTAPGLDRAQFFPWISAGADGGLDAIWYDQRAGVEGSDLTDVLATHSEDGGLTWACPVSLLAEPFHAEYGQDTGQPNIGDYNQCASQVTAGVRRMFASYARTDAADHLTTAPDTYVGVLDPATPGVSLTPAGVAIADLGCIADQALVAGELGDLTVSLQNACAGAVSGINGTLAALSAGVSILQPASAYPDLAPGASSAGATPFRIRLDDAYPCGDPIRLRMEGTSNSGVFGFTFTVPTGVVVKDTLLLAEGFESVATGLPAGWSHIQRKGVANPWEVSADLASAGTRSVYCADYADTNWSRLDSPSFTVPPDADLLEVSFAVTYDTEAVGDGRQGYDGSVFKIRVDGVDVLAGAFSTLFDGQYRTQIVRSSGDLANPLQDLAAWCGNTLPDFEPIRIQYPGLAGRSVRLVYEAGADASVGGTGTYVDDVQVRAITLGCGACTAEPVLAVNPTGIVYPELRAGVEACTTITVKNTGDGFLHIQSITDSDPACGLDLSGLATELFPGDSTSFSACITESEVGPDTCEVIVATDAGADTVRIVVVEVTGVGGLPLHPPTLLLLPVRPNPFRSGTEILFAVPQDGPTDLAIFDVTGRRVRTFHDGATLSRGPYQLFWDGRDDRGVRVGNGVYTLHLRSGGEARTERMVYLR